MGPAMDLKAFFADLVEGHLGILTVDNTSGGVKFDPDKLVYQGETPTVVRCTLEGGDIRYRTDPEIGAAASGDLMINGDEWFVPGLVAHQFRAFQVTVTPGVIRYHVYF